MNKRNFLTLTVGVLLVVIFGLWLCSYQVRSTEVAVVTRFGKPGPDITEPGWHAKLPPPIELVYKFDQRVQTSEVENKLREDFTADNNPLLTSVYIGWKITKPGVFLRKFPGGIASADQQLGNIVSSTKSQIIGKHPLSDFVSSTGSGSKFTAIEDQILATVQDQLKAADYGIDVQFLGFKRVGLPEETTQKVFDRMTSERQVLVSQLQHEGEAKAEIIRSDANLQASKILSAAQGEALQIQGRGQAEAAKYLNVFQQNPDLASFMFRLDALENSLNKSTLIFDQQDEPFTLFKGTAKNSTTK